MSIPSATPAPATLVPGVAERSIHVSSGPKSGHPSSKSLLLTSVRGAGVKADSRPQRGRSGATRLVRGEPHADAGALRWPSATRWRSNDGTGSITGSITSSR